MQSRHGQRSWSEVEETELTKTADTKAHVQVDVVSHEQGTPIDQPVKRGPRIGWSVGCRGQGVWSRCVSPGVLLVLLVLVLVLVTAYTVQWTD
jgi:hypothetical protein